MQFFIVFGHNCHLQSKKKNANEEKMFDQERKNLEDREKALKCKMKEPYKSFVK